MLHYVHNLGNRNLERITGIFVLSALAVVIVVLLNIEPKPFFNGSYKIHVVLEQGFGLKEGSPVNISGVQVGNIESIRINHRNKIDVIAGIQSKYKDKIRVDSFAEVESQGLMGNMTLSISIGSSSMPVVEEGEYIRGMGMSKSEGIFGGINPVLIKANTAVENIIALTNSLEKPLTRMDNILQNMDEVSSKIKAGEGNVGALLNDDALYSELKSMVDSSTRLLKSVEKAAVNIELASNLLPEVIVKAEASMSEISKSAEKIPSLLSTGQEIISNIKTSSEDFNKLIGDSSKQVTHVRDILKDLKSASSELPDVIKSAQGNMDEVTRIIEGAEKNWIVKGLIERENQGESIIVDVRDSRYRKNGIENEKR